MVKRIFIPFWKTEEIEKQLSELEAEGWRLEKISGFGNFEFVSATPKKTDYIIVFHFIRDSASEIYSVMHELKTRGAIEIKGNLTNLLVSTNVFRITKDCDNTDIRGLRDKELKHILIGKLLFYLFFVCLILFAFIMTVFVQKKSLIYDGRSCFETVLLIGVGVISLIGFIYHLTGFIYLKKKNRN